MSDLNDSNLNDIFNTSETPAPDAAEMPVADNMSNPDEQITVSAPAEETASPVNTTIEEPVAPVAPEEPAAPAEPVQNPNPAGSTPNNAAPDYSRYYSSGYTYTGTADAGTATGSTAGTNPGSTGARSTYTATNGYTGGTPGYTGARKTAAKPKQKKSVGWGAIIAVALCCSLLGGIVGSAGTWYLTKQLTPVQEALQEAKQEAEAPEAAAPEETPVSTINYADNNQSTVVTTTATSSGMTAADVYAANVNSTVGITTSITTTNYFGMTTTGAASGSGFILTADGYIVTNYHVIEDANAITVTTYDNTTYDATLVGYDESNDIAVLKVDATDLQPVTIGSSDDLRVGDQVAAIGNPLGELTFSLTCGVVSALDRKVTVSSGTTMNLLQTDCAINSGNSGGALFNMNGEVIGITNAKYSSSSSSSSASIDNVGFAIPISQVMPMIESIMEKGYVSKAYLGVSVSAVSEDVQAFGYPAGAVIRSIVEGSPAEEAGLAVQDIITSVNGTEVTDSEAFADFIGSCKAGDTITMEIYREGETLTITAVLAEKALVQTTTSSQEETTPSGNGSNGYGYGYGNGNGNGSNGYGYGYGYGNGNGNGNGNGYSYSWPFNWG